jgi:hypothetical protein
LWVNTVSRDNAHPGEFWQLRAAVEMKISEVALGVERQAAAALGVERLWSRARLILTGNHRAKEALPLHVPFGDTIHKCKGKEA